MMKEIVFHLKYNRPLNEAETMKVWEDFNEYFVEANGCHHGGSFSSDHLSGGIFCYECADSDIVMEEKTRAYFEQLDCFGSLEFLPIEDAES